MNGEYVWPDIADFQQQAGNILAYSISRYRISVSLKQVIIYHQYNTVNVPFPVCQPGYFLNISFEKDNTVNYFLRIIPWTH